jgi:hypothetical protein
MRILAILPTFGVRATTLALAVLALGVLGCPKQEDFPAALDLTAPPTPSDFEIIDNGQTAYRFQWVVSDPTNVDRYRLYLMGGPFGPELVYEGTDPFYDETFGFSIQDLQFAVSAVGTNDVEGYRTVATAP